VTEPALASERGASADATVKLREANELVAASRAAKERLVSSAARAAATDGFAVVGAPPAGQAGGGGDASAGAAALGHFGDALDRLRRAEKRAAAAAEETRSVVFAVGSAVQQPRVAHLAPWRRNGFQVLGWGGGA
jgi:hypothetical protein